ncbi:single-stranded-DNA-specific exonuclease RecJ [Marinicella meishanensis]|uniref:single-stranded-DNA-specific exonuclease RecJ n=1 Tax=Marinicella meishanensis TaxID=2873263 RepID=UPI001CBF30B4|nr:single-stranded-DNA-specific exonuclease RecJ [Marinicella sp. NBU2979]
MTSAKLIRRPSPDTELAGGEHLHPLIQRLYLTRGITDYAQVNYQLKHLHHPSGFKGIKQAAEQICDAMAQQQRVVVVGDFDADGATATAVVIRALRAMGAEHLNFLVPNRFEYGYGLTVELVAELVKLKADLVITVDNGISSLRGVDAANQAGMSVIITDHHLPPDELPAAAAIVNPNCADDGFPSKALAGVGVAFYLMTVVKQELSQRQWFEQRSLPEPNLTTLLDLVALGTVADVVPLDANNRILIDAGLKRIAQGSCVIGLSALFTVAGCQQASADANALAFYIAPRLNAAGRLEDMGIGINLLLTDDPAEARVLAAQLHDINQQRKAIQADMQRFADSVVAQLKQRAELPPALCLFHENWHQGVVGLLASKVKEFTHRPVVAFALESAESDRVKGSARSIQGLHIRDALVNVSTRHPELIEQFGGHAMAAGLTIKKAKLKDFKQAFAEEVALSLTADLKHRTIHSDGSVATEDLSLHVAELIQQAGPWGQRFEPPLFDDWFIIKQKSLVGDNHTKLTLQTPDQQKQIAAIAFNRHPNDFLEPEHRMHLCYQMMVNEFRQKRSLQLKIDHIL